MNGIFRSIPTGFSTNHTFGFSWRMRSHTWAFTESHLAAYSVFGFVPSRWREMHMTEYVVQSGLAQMTSGCPNRATISSAVSFPMSAFQSALSASLQSTVSVLWPRSLNAADRTPVPEKRSSTFIVCFLSAVAVRF